MADPIKPKVNAKGASVVQRERGELRRAIGGGGFVRNKIDYYDLAKQGIPDSWDTWRTMQSRSVNIPDRSQMFNRRATLNPSQVTDRRTPNGWGPPTNKLQEGVLDTYWKLRAVLNFTGEQLGGREERSEALDKLKRFNKK